MFFRESFFSGGETKGPSPLASQTVAGRSGVSMGSENISPGARSAAGFQSWAAPIVGTAEDLSLEILNGGRVKGRAIGQSATRF